LHDPGFACRCRVRRAIEAASATTLSTTPDLNPIKLSYSAFKAFQRKCARTPNRHFPPHRKQFVRRLSAEAHANFFSFCRICCNMTKIRSRTRLCDCPGGARSWSGAAKWWPAERFSSHATSYRQMQTAALPNRDPIWVQAAPRVALIECLPSVRSDCHSEDGYYVTAGQKPAA
jgi:hypothetical protein